MEFTAGHEVLDLLGADRVRHGVGMPFGRDPAREAVLGCRPVGAHELPCLLPDDVTQGSISTLPLAWRTAYGNLLDCAASDRPRDDCIGGWRRDAGCEDVDRLDVIDSPQASAMARSIARCRARLTCKHHKHASATDA